MTESTPTLKTTYASPTNPPFTLTQPLPPHPRLSNRSNPSAKTAYLSALRKATSQMQEDINKELTMRMEEDNAVDMASKAKGGVDEAKEEDNYGEEVPEED
ncbi:hypothetical protein LHYA1_G006477 [Lachnellula hyalina]|uniref:EKC/KEOPS complex subunit GON7 n=1 Tax=Lachnellula hyalina TaxID=1316788 RepID=A0A8H8TZM1_9HELO|nr:uncharacterized protein LHYA1_G006477 [Lachnellula hyalina]TVY25136.1 hypothetical protein LHYA1_G006477 [Lachnellula hyalina]